MNTATTWPSNQNSGANTENEQGFFLINRLRQLWAFNWFTTLVLLLHLLAIPIYLAAAILDPRLITNAPAFVKPFKFVLSIAVYLATFLWLTTLAQRRRWWVHFLSTVTALGLLIEIALITLQAVRGVPSHYNQATPFDAFVFNTMGMVIVVVSLMNLLLAIWLLFQRLPNPTIAWALRLGVFISFAGMIVAFLMTGTPSPAQRAEIEAGERPVAFGAHSVGVEDGGPGLPFVGWSTEGGDLRVAHFVGLHGIQVIPLLALLLGRSTLTRRRQIFLVLVGGIAYVAWLALLTWQALRGQSIVSPDALTLQAYAALAGFVALNLAFSLMPWRKATPT